MKLKLQNLLFLFLLGAIGAKAQGPVITASGFNPQVGDKIKWQYTHSSSVTPPEPGGANSVWDYSNLKDSGAIYVYNIVSPKGLPFADSFPTSNIAIANDTTSIEYWQTSNKGWGSVGFYYKYTSGGIDLHKTNAIENYIVYPMSYQKVYTDSVSFNANFYDGSSWTPYSGMQYDTLIADGYGTLKLPGATFNNVLRVFNHSGTSNGSNGGGEYFFYTNGIHFPLLVISSNTSYDNGVETITSWIADYYKGTALPLQFSSFTAAWQNKTPYLQWSAANTENTKQFNIQRSIDSKNFVTVGQVGINGGSAYHYQDNTAPNSTVFYRLQQVDKIGQAFYSSTARLTVNSLPLTVFPNPARGAIHLTIPATSQAQVFIYDIAGKLVYQNKNFSSANTIATDTFSKGTYTIHLKDNDGWKVSSFEKE